MSPSRRAWRQVRGWGRAAALAPRPTPSSRRAAWGASAWTAAPPPRRCVYRVGREASCSTVRDIDISKVITLLTLIFYNFMNCPGLESWNLKVGYINSVPFLWLNILCYTLMTSCLRPVWLCSQKLKTQNVLWMIEYLNIKQLWVICYVKYFTWKYRPMLHFLCSCLYLFTFLLSSKFYWHIRLKSTAYFFDPPSQKLIGKGKLGLRPWLQNPERILTKPAIYNYIAGMTAHAYICISDFS